MSELPPSVVTGTAPREEEAVGVALSLARQLAQWHQVGRWHGQVGVRTVTFDDAHGPRLTEPEAFFRLGDSAGDWERLPPILHDRLPLELSSDLSLARRRLTAVGIGLDPVQIDLYSLAALLCRWITGESASAFLRSPKVKRLVPDALQPILERALGSQAEYRFVDLAEFADALQAAGGPIDQLTEPFHSHPSERSATGDTTPSRLSALPGNDTSVIGPASEGVAPKPATPDRDREPRSGPPEGIPFATLGHYEIRQRIGHGGMGDVYLGYERPLDRLVAIKVLPAELARDAEFVRRFRVEATAVARLNHPNIVPIHFIGEDQGHHFYAMQFIEGVSLADLLARRGKLTVDEVLPIVQQTLAGLGLAHDHGMVHRDIKPGNILLDQKSRRALLADFGLVKSLSSSVTGKTATGIVMGTVDYISPEQGRGLAVDARSDLYSIGVLLFRMLSGKLPFTADSPTALIFQHVYESPPSLREINPDIPQWLVTVVETLLAKAPEERYQSATELLSDLRRAGCGLEIIPEEDGSSFESEEQPAIVRYGWWEKAVDRARTIFRRHSPEFLRDLHGTQVQIDAAIEVQGRRRRALEQLATEAEEVLRGLRQQADSHRSHVKSVVERMQSANTPALAEQARQDEQRARHDASELEEQTKSQQEQIDSIQLRLAQVRVTWERLHAQRDMLKARLKVAASRTGASARTKSGWPPNWKIGTWLQFVALVSLAGFALFVIRDFATYDGSRPSVGAIVSQEPGEANFVRAIPFSASSTKTVLPLLRFNGHEGYVTAIAFHPDGTILAASGDDGIIRLWNPQSGNLIATLPETASGRQDSITVLAFSPGGQWLLSGNTSSRGGSLKLWNVESRNLARILPGETESIKAACINPAEDRIFAVTTVDTRPMLFEWELSSGTERRRVALSEAPNAWIRSAQFSPDASRLALGLDKASDLDSGRGVWDVSTMKQICKFDERPVSWDRDGLRVVTANEEKFAVWKVPEGHKIQEIGDLGGELTSVTFGPGERMLVGVKLRGEFSGKTLVVDLSTAQIRQTFTGQVVLTAQYGPDGLRIATGGTEPELLLWEAALPPLQATRPVHEAPKGTLLAVSSDGQTIVAGNKNTGIALLSSSDGKWHSLPSWESEEVDSLAITADGRLAAAGGRDGTIAIWNLSTRKLFRQTRLLKDPQAAVSDTPPHATSLTFTPDATRLYALRSPFSVIAWDVATGTESVAFESFGTSMNCIAACPNGRHLLSGGSSRTGSGGDLHLWDLETGTRVRRFIGHAEAVNCIAFPHTGNSVFSGARDVIHQWNLDSGEEIRRLKVPAVWVHAMALSPDDRRIAATGNDRIGVWDLETGEHVYQVEGDRGWGTSLGFAADGRHLWSADKRGIISTWDLSANPLDGDH